MLVKITKLTRQFMKA